MADLIAPGDYELLGYAEDPHTMCRWEEWNLGRLELESPPNTHVFVTLVVGGTGRYYRDDQLGAREDFFRPGLVGFTMPFDKMDAACDPVQIAGIGMPLAEFRARTREFSGGRDIELADVSMHLHEWTFVRELIAHFRDRVRSGGGKDHPFDGTVDLICSALAQRSNSKTESVLSDRGLLSLPQQRKIDDHIAEHFAEKVLVQDLAALVGLGPRHFNRLFRNTYGTSPLNHILEIRLHEARRFLSRGDYRITDVANACGFASSSGFSEQYKRRFGIVPSRDRRRR